MPVVIDLVDFFFHHRETKYIRGISVKSETHLRKSNSRVWVIKCRSKMVISYEVLIDVD